MGIAAVIFDIGNVLIGWQPERFYDARIGRGAREALFSAVDLHAMNDRIDAGEGFAKVVADTQAAHPDHAEPIGWWQSHWSDLAGPEVPGTAELLDRLKARGVPVHALSNISREAFEMAGRDYPALSRFDRAFVSGDMRLIKPDSAIYRAVEEALGILPERLLFIDDRAENVKAAAARGWQVHHFTEAATLETRLIREGLL